MKFFIITIIVLSLFSSCKKIDELVLSNNGCGTKNYGSTKNLESYFKSMATIFKHQLVRGTIDIYNNSNEYLATLNIGGNDSYFSMSSDGGSVATIDSINILEADLELLFTLSNLEWEEPRLYEINFTLEELIYCSDIYNSKFNIEVILIAEVVH